MRYPPELEVADVRRVYNHFTFDCKERQQQPTKKLFLGYLRREAEEMLRRGQLALPATGSAQMVAPRFEPGARPAVAGLPAPGNVSYPLNPDPQCPMCESREEFRTSGGLYCTCRICQLCYGVGHQVVKGQGARRCPHLTGEVDERRARAG